MRNKTAAIFFVTICTVLAILLLMKVVKIFFSGIVFAVALVIFGLLSWGFRLRH